MATEFEIGQYVRKKKGYLFPGIVIAKFNTTRGFIRYVVECTVPETGGILHIFAAETLELDQ